MGVVLYETEAYPPKRKDTPLASELTNSRGLCLHSRGDTILARRLYRLVAAKSMTMSLFIRSESIHREGIVQNPSKW